MARYGKTASNLLVPMGNFWPERNEPFTPNAIGDTNAEGDPIRVDLTGDPFYSIDPPGSAELDDAIRTSYTSDGNFKLEVAVADGGQIDPNSDHMNYALAFDVSYYDRPFRRLLFGANVIRALELRNVLHHRALVVSQEFDRKCDLVKEPEVMPAWVDTRSYTYGDVHDDLWTDEMINADYNKLKSIGKRQLGRTAFRESMKRDRARRYRDENFVAVSMALANGGMAEWVDGKIPVPYRIYDPKFYYYDDKGEQKWAYYSRSPQPHAEFDRLAKYMHGTSALRRSKDTVAHQQIGAYLAGKELPYKEEDIDEHSGAVELFEIGSHE
jgi:exoribonuclease II